MYKRQVLKRITSGVKLMHVDSENGIKVANIAKVREQVRTDQELSLIHIFLPYI